MIEVKQGSQCVYVGPGPGRGVKHIVTMVLQESDGVEVVTWSKPQMCLAALGPDAGIAGYSFLGPFKDFQACFRAIT